MAADNLGAHSIGGFVESFSGHYVCRFCTGKHSDFQSKEVRSGSFHLRTKEEHSEHVRTVLEDEAMNNCYGVKRNCALTEKLSHFHVLTGYLPDVLIGVCTHEQGIVWEQWERGAGASQHRQSKEAASGGSFQVVSGERWDRRI